MGGGSACKCVLCMCVCVCVCLCACDVLTATSLATQASVAKEQPNVNGVGKINLKSSVMVPRYCSGPHAKSAKDRPFWNKEKEIQRTRVEKRFSFPDARQSVEAKSPSNGFISAISPTDMLTKMSLSTGFISTPSFAEAVFRIRSTDLQNS